MSDIKRLIHLIHRRSIWQVTLVYLGTAWVVLQVAEHVIEQFGLPEWVYGGAVLLLLLGFPIVIATAFVQEAEPPRREGEPVRSGLWEGREPGAERRAASAAGERAGVRGLFTWQNAIVGGLLAFVLLGVGAGAWLLFAPGASDITAALPIGREPPALRSSDGERGAADSPAGADAHEEAARTGVDPAGGPARERDAADEVAGRARGSEGAGSGRLSGRESRTTAPATPPAELRRLELRTGRARDGAVEAGGLSADPGGVAEADSLRGRAEELGAAGRYVESAELLERARVRYAEIRRRIEERTTRYDSARRAVAALREEADRSLPSYATGREWERRAVEEPVEESEGLERALAHLDRAAASYRRAAARAGEDPGTADATPDRAALREAVGETLGRLERALEAEDLEALRDVWVGMGDEEARNFESFFREQDEIDVALDVDWTSLEAGEEGAAVTVRTTWRFVNERSGRRGRQGPFEQRLEMERRGERWVVVEY